MTRYVAYLAAGLALCAPPRGEPNARAQPPETSAANARRVLPAAGLSPSGKYWLTADEDELRRQLALAPREEKALHAAQQQFRALLGQFQQARGQLQRSRNRLSEIAELLGANSTSSLQKQQLEGESGRLGEQIKQTEQIISGRLNVLDESSEMTVATVELVNAQTTLSVRLLEIRRLAAALPGQYRELRDDQQVRQALSALANESLGPIENYAAQLRRLERLDATLFGAGAPFYRRSNQIRVAAILDDRLPVTFSYTGPTGPTLLPASVLTALGVSLENLPAGEPVRLEESAAPTRRVILSRLRVGKFEWRDVAVDVLPPEADHLGARISAQAFAPRQVTIDESKLWFGLGGEE